MGLTLSEFASHDVGLLIGLRIIHEANVIKYVD